MAGTLTNSVAAEVRAQMARRQISGAALARRLGLSYPYVSRRLNGVVPFDVADLESIAEVLGVPVTDLLGAPGRAA